MDPEQRSQTLYEISLAVESRKTLEETAERALTAYVEGLDCAVGAVFSVDDNGPMPSLVTAVPAESEQNDYLSAAQKRLETLLGTETGSEHQPQTPPTPGTPSLPESLPLSEGVDGSGRYHLMALPEFGVLVVGSDEGLPAETVSALAPLNEKLARACASASADQRCQDQRDRSESASDSPPESVVDAAKQGERTQTLEELSDAVQDLLGESSRRQVCRQTVDAVESTLGYPNVGVHLYNREVEALEPAAMTEQFRAQFDGEPQQYTARDTVVWEVYETGESVRIDDVSAFDGTLPSEKTPTESVVILPIGIHGVLIASATNAGAFDNRDVSFLRLLSQLVAVALDKLATQNRLTGVQQTISAALQTETHEEMTETVLDRFSDILDLPVAGVWKYQPAQAALEPLGVTSDARELFDTLPTFTDADSSLAWKAFESGSSILVSDVSKHPEVYNPETPVKGEVIVPIGEFGVLTAGSPYENSFTQLDAEILEVFATNLEVVAEILDNRQDVTLLEQVIARILRHNVRNKLTPIRGYANTIIDEADQHIETYAEAVIENCEELERTAEHAREMRTVVQRRNDIVTVSLAEATRTTARTVAPEFPDGALTVVTESAPDVTAHAELPTALGHLIRNGFEHNDSDQPQVTVTVENRAAGPAVEIADNGPGIDTYDVEILDKHGESALDHGSGAGLWIVDRVIEYSDALLSFETDEGTTATVTFPTAPTE